jgi:TonB family protein
MRALVGAVSLAAATAALAQDNSDFLAKHYPPGALQRGEQGRVGFDVTVEPGGFMSACTISASSGYPLLDRETCEFLMMNAKFPEVKTAAGRKTAAIHSGSINWTLPRAATRVAAAAPAPSGQPLTLICKRFKKAGNRLTYVRQCLTESEWTLKSNMVQDDMRRLQNIGSVIPSGPDCRKC